MLYASDLISQYYPWYYIVAQNLRGVRLPHWISSYPLLAEGETGVLSPINSLILLIFPFPFSVKLLFFTYGFIGFVGMFLFLKSINLNIISRLLGGFIFVFSGFIVSRYFQPSIIFASLLLPWGMYLIHSRNIHWLPLIIYLQFTAGHTQMAIISILGYFVYANFLKISLKKIILFIMLGLGLSAIQLLPSLQLFKVSDRRNWDPMIKFSYSLHPSHLITYIDPLAFGISKPGDDAGFSQIGGGFWELNLTIWTIPFLLSLIPLFSLRRNTLILYLVWLIFLVLSFGGYTPVYRLLAKILSFPFRAPSRFLLLATFSAASLSAIGFHQLSKRKPITVQLLMLILVVAISVLQFLSLKNYFIFAPLPISLLPTTTPLPLNPAINSNPQAFIIAFNQGLVISLTSLLIWRSFSR